MSRVIVLEKLNLQNKIKKMQNAQNKNKTVMANALVLLNLTVLEFVEVQMVLEMNVVSVMEKEFQKDNVTAKEDN